MATSTLAEDPNAVFRNGFCVFEPDFGVDGGDLSYNECTVWCVHVVTTGWFRRCC